MEKESLARVLEAAIMAYQAPLSLEKMQQLFEETQAPTQNELQAALSYLAEQCQERGVELLEVASGYRFQSKQEYAPFLVKLWEEKPQRYSRATLETLVLIAYRQPITRAEIEEIRGVSVSSYIIKSMLEREWIRLVGHRDVPGKPSLFGTTKKFLDYFNLTSLKDLPTLADVQDLDFLGQHLQEELDLEFESAAMPGVQTVGELEDTVTESESHAEQSVEAATEKLEPDVMHEPEASIMESELEDQDESEDFVLDSEHDEKAELEDLVMESEQDELEDFVMESAHDEDAEPEDIIMESEFDDMDEGIDLEDESSDALVEPQSGSGKKSWIDLLNKLGQDSANETSLPISALDEEEMATEETSPKIDEDFHHHE
jgi:segregation and condensation protein B